MMLEAQEQELFPDGRIFERDAARKSGRAVRDPPQRAKASELVIAQREEPLEGSGLEPANAKAHARQRIARAAFESGGFRPSIIPPSPKVESTATRTPHEPRRPSPPGRFRSTAGLALRAR